MLIRRNIKPLLAGLTALLIAPTSWGQLVNYEQNFDGLEASDPNALGNSGDGWQIFGSVFDGDTNFPPDGNFKFGYGPFSAPNGGPAFSAIASGEGPGGPADQYINAYSDYNCCGPGVSNEGHFDPTAPFDRVESIVFQEQTIGAGDIGSIWYFTFDAKLPSRQILFPSTPRRSVIAPGAAMSCRSTSAIRRSTASCFSSGSNLSRSNSVTRVSITTT